ncbi:MAG: bifunctional [glutamate--ammonia ligase]-adenylyl-L-tyrosine phosphorylase/[glutamate--ammonia-ligase] adenylyltransferase [Pseudomonadota bacterium]|nr:bifunctional [glutamate--ammonia ligase]-adenylyl-L-tyrosine phosphorylase/[glutamate--ammonia-ligase] adenylyltransferase [Pseudomonadota bacterium]
MSTITQPAADHTVIANLLAGSRAARSLLHADPALEARLLALLPTSSLRLATTLPAGWTDPADEDALARTLRRDRNLLFLHTAARDLNGLADLAEVMGAWSEFAESAVCKASLAAEQTLRPRHGTPRDDKGNAQQLIPVAMGKLGGRELNVSSDVDLVFAYGEGGGTDGSAPISNQEFFAQATRRVVRLLDERTADGFVFRVDTRLRPDGPSGPPAISFAALEVYLESQGRPWERHAWLKARALTQPHGGALASLVEPFVYRRYLDYGAIASLRELHSRMLADNSRRERERDIKIGPGGIREIEFTAQLFQLIRGGHDPGLRLRPTRAALAALADRGILDSASARTLDDTYVFLRRTEHRLQYFDDAQTHRVPMPGADLDQLAASLDFADSAGLMAELARRREHVSELFARALGKAPGARDGLPGRATGVGPPAEEAWTAVQAEDRDAAAAALERLGSPDALACLPFLEDLARGRAWRSASEAGRERLGRLVRQTLELSGARLPMARTLRGVFGVLNAIGGRETYFALLDEFPAALQRLADISAASPWASDFLARFPALLDELVHLHDVRSHVGAHGIADEIARTVGARDGDVEAQMDALRRLRQRFQFRLALLDIEGLISVQELGDRLSDLADACIATALTQAAGPDGFQGFAVTGFGKLGGKELGYNSDLDLVFVYDPERMEGSRAARLAQKLITWLATPTGAGIVYDTDVRLRPDGISGLLVSSITALRDYEHHRAWTWEHQALTRARACAGDVQVGHAFEDLRREILAQPRDGAALASEVTDMRARMRREHPGSKAGASEWDVKRGSGGLVDVEFMVQYLVLAHAHDHPELLANSGNIALLQTCGRLGLAPRIACGEVAEAYGRMRGLQHRLQLAGEPGGVLARAEAEPGPTQVEALWKHLFGAPPP